MNDEAPITQTGTIDITPRGAKTPEGCARIHEAAEKLHAKVLACADLFSELLDTLTDNGSGLEGNLVRIGLDQADAEQLADDCREAMHTWKAAGNDYLKALTGAP